MKNVARCIKKNLIIIIILTLCLAFIAFSVAYADTKECAHTINLNDGLPIIEERDHIFNPDSSVEKEFFIESRSEKPVYYNNLDVDIEYALLDANRDAEGNILESEWQQEPGESTVLTFAVYMHRIYYYYGFFTNFRIHTNLGDFCLG